MGRPGNWPPFVLQNTKMLVSAILPTRGRPGFAHRALDCALRQAAGEYGLEIVILDDLDSPSFFNAPEFQGVHYHLSEKRLSIGEKRNRLCELANGDVIVHFDDDDYSAPGRVNDQLDRLMSSGAALTGYSEMLFESETGECWLHSGDEHYAIGTSMMFRKSFWRSHPFVAGAGRSVDFVGEDTVFLGQARAENAVVCVPAGQMMLARIHSGNTVTKKPVEGHRWKRVERVAA